MSDPDIIQNTTPDYRVTHVFSINDITGGFDGATVEDTPSIIDLTADPKLVKDTPPLFPIDSEFGFIVTDFSGAVEKERDGIYTEGWAGNLADGTGLAVSDAPTDTFKTPAVLGTWLAGLGGNSVKASTEHYTVMQNVLSNQAYPDDPDAVYTLDDDLRMIDLWPTGLDGALEAGVLHDLYIKDLAEALQVGIDNVGTGTQTWTGLVDFNRDGVFDESFDTWTVTAPGTSLDVGVVDIDQDGEWDLIDRGLNGYNTEAGIADILTPNESTIENNIAFGNDYSVTLKDDGKLLYRWGNEIKRPNDIRLEVDLPLPEEWGTPDPETGLIPLFRVTAAELATEHTITNNPNDQIRPEDFENEAAIGILPDFSELAGDVTLADGTTLVAGTWVSNTGYFAGDGTFYPGADPDLVDYTTLTIDEITVLKDPNLVTNTEGSTLDQIGALSSDLEQGFTNAWYTTMDREPFTAIPDGEGGYIMGPRWRLQTDKYGQDLPGVVIPIDPSVTANPTRDQVKYEVGADTLTVLNLLDWESSVSPLSLSAGFANNAGTVSVNGLNMTTDFDVAFYVKGDVKPATLYNTELIMSYEELPIIAAGGFVFGNAGSDYLVGMGGNTFIGDANLQPGETGDSDLFVLSYGSRAGDVFDVSTIIDFNIAEDVIGLIGVGADTVELDTAMPDTNIGQTLGVDGLTISVDGNDIALLDGVTELLTAENFFTSSQPGSVNTITGTVGDEDLIGTAFADEIFALAGNDTVEALGGNDAIHGDEGDDWLLGNTGKDTVYGGDGNDTVLGGQDDDLLFGDIGNDLMRGGKGDDSAYGGDGTDQILGLDGNDFLQGNIGNDTVSGGDGDDDVRGGQGDDALSGDAGQDKLYGALGNDVLTGGDDADVFMFTTGAAGAAFGNDTVTDFVLGVDSLGFNEAVWGGGLTATQVVDSFASVVGSDVIFDFDISTVTLSGLSTTIGLENDLLFV